MDGHTKEKTERFLDGTKNEQWRKQEQNGEEKAGDPGGFWEGDETRMGKYVRTCRRKRPAKARWKCTRLHKSRGLTHPMECAYA